MKVKEAIKLLLDMPDKELELFVDCPYCGRGNQLAAITECVLLKSKSMAAEKGKE